MSHKRWTSRKFWTVNIWQLVASFMLWFDKIDGGTYAMLTAGLIGIYAAANFGDKKIEVKEDV